MLPQKHKHRPVTVHTLIGHMGKITATIFDNILNFQIIISTSTENLHFLTTGQLMHIRSCDQQKCEFDRYGDVIWQLERAIFHLHGGVFRLLISCIEVELLPCQYMY